ncbi:MAG TPA: tetratricopeptide repeat protein [Hanamia sp.]|nr:tetratricopeptide repeat protein [Hanamia sp.]
MKKILFAIIFWSLAVNVTAQQEDAEQLHENAKAFMQQGDYGNATLILTRALQQAPQNLEIAKDLSLSYFLQKEDQKALNVIKPFVDNDNADDQTYQLAGTIYRRLGQEKQADKNYKDALRKFPSSGGLYNDYGELLFNNRDPEAIKEWEKGIEMDPSFGYNYYNACKYYYYKRNYIWCLLYGEIFINIESFTSRTAEIKDILLDGYKKLFADPDLLANVKDKSAFEIAFLTCMNKQNDVVIRGINPETLTMIRTRFILDWNRNYAKQYPFRLFDLQEQFLEEGLFPAYNQWIFGASQNLAAYQNWTSNHSDEADNFKKFKAGIIFKIPKGQYYH